MIGEGYEYAGEREGAIEGVWAFLAFKGGEEGQEILRIIADVHIIEGAVIRREPKCLFVCSHDRFVIVPEVGRGLEFKHSFP